MVAMRFFHAAKCCAAPGAPICSSFPPVPGLQYISTCCLTTNLLELSYVRSSPQKFTAGNYRTALSQAGCPTNRIKQNTFEVAT